MRRMRRMPTGDGGWGEGRVAQVGGVLCVQAPQLSDCLLRAVSGVDMWRVQKQVQGSGGCRLEEDEWWRRRMWT